eukprot:361743-Chlamydomonas_euryale.AAC.6
MVLQSQTTLTLRDCNQCSALATLAALPLQCHQCCSQCSTASIGSSGLVLLHQPTHAARAPDEDRSNLARSSSPLAYRTVHVCVPVGAFIPTDKRRSDSAPPQHPAVQIPYISPLNTFKQALAE